MSVSPPLGCEARQGGHETTLPLAARDDQRARVSPSHAASHILPFAFAQAIGPRRAVGHGVAHDAGGDALACRLADVTPLTLTSFLPCGIIST